MRNAILIFIIGSTFLLLFVYLAGSVSPFDTEKLETLIEERKIQKNDRAELEAIIQNIADGPNAIYYLSSSFLSGVAIMIAGTGLVFISFHLALDKLFFKKFFEPPSLQNAVRRGVLISTGLFIYLYIKLNNLNPVLLAVGLIALLVVELIVISGKRERSRNNNKELPLEEPLPNQPHQ